MEIKKGDILLVHSHGILGRIIQFGMNLERWLRLDIKKHKVYNHAAIATHDGVIAEALAIGITIRGFEKAYGKRKKVDLLVYRPNWTEDELFWIPVIANQYHRVNYQFLNFIQYAIKIFTGIWFGKTHKQAQDKLYCTEFVSLVVHKIKPEMFKKYWRSSPNDVYKWCRLNCELVAEYKL